MLIDTKIEIIVTNNGHTNSFGVSTDKSQKLIHTLVAIDTANNSYLNLFEKYVNKFGPFNEKEVETLLNSITLDELYNKTENEKSSY